MFNSVGSRVNFPQNEEKQLEFWKQNQIFKKSVQNREGRPSFILYDGPPTVNGSPAIHHVFTSTFKDVIPRYKAMKGYYTPRIAGWDTHGLPVELAVEKQLGFTNKAQIEEYGIAKFNAICQENVMRYIKEFAEVIERVGYWVDMGNAYVTLKNEYIETGWWTIKQLWDKGLVYQGYRVTPHCPRCGTSLSSHEVAQGYQDDTEDPSVYIKFRTHLKSSQKSVTLEKLCKLAAEKKTYLLAWTTTPWTLPGNTALAVGANAEYSVVEVDNEYLVFADTLRKQVGLGDNPVIEKLPGKELVGVEYEPLFNPHDFGIERRRFESATDLNIQEPNKKLAYHVVATDFVSMEDGTGIVHIAPAYGEADYQAGQEYGLDFVHNVDLQGKIIGTYPFAGKFIKAADPLVLEDLKKRGLLLKRGTIRHTYPFCWRCNAPLVYYAKQSWYIKTTAVKDALINGNKEINWYPEHIKEGRFGDWLENNVDWAFSRERYWGTPLPIWKCEKCGAFECVGGVSELKAKTGFSGLKEPLDLHRPFIDDATFTCSKCGGKMKRAPEVIDCWFDSGNMPIAQYHYPFENKKMLEDGRFPADYICEAMDQTRGWFYSLHALSTLLFNSVSYRNVICLGLILDAKGEKQSKSKGNVVWPWEMVKKHGADTLRWYLITASSPGKAWRFDEKDLIEAARGTLMTLWNVYSFLVTYANIDKYTPYPKKTTTELPELDRWILSELNQLILDVDSALENYNPTSASRKIGGFVDMLSNWYVRRSRRRFWKSESDTDKLSAYNTLYQCLVTVSKLLAPFTPFIAEEMYQNLVRAVDKDAPISVHLTDFPVADESKIDRNLSASIQLAMKLSSLGRATRAKAGIKVRQPLDICYVINSPENTALVNMAIIESVQDEINVKHIELVTPEKLASMAKDPINYVVDSELAAFNAICKIISPELAMEGLAREIVHRLQTMRKSAGFEIADYITTYYQGDEYLRQVMTDTKLADYLRQETLSRELIESKPEEGVYTETFKLSGHSIIMGVKKIS